MALGDGKLKDGVIVHAGANTPGWISNLGISYSAGTLTITGSDGSALSKTNPGFITVPSTTAGQVKTLKVTGNYSFNDDAHASSDLTNLGFGITESSDWATDLPFFIYAVNKGNTDFDGADGSSVFAIARKLVLNSSPSSANNIGDTGAIPVNDSEDVILIMKDVTVANYTALPCQLIGSFDMQWSSATTDWTVQTLGNTDGLGDIQLIKKLSKTFVLPTGQNGASASTHFLPNGGTAPVFLSISYTYKINLSGLIDINVALSGDGGADGAGAVDARIALPFSSSTTTGSQFIGSQLYQTAPASCPASGILTYLLGSISISTSYISLENMKNSSATDGEIIAMNNANYSSGNRIINIKMSYRAF